MGENGGRKSASEKHWTIFKDSEKMKAALRTRHKQNGGSLKWASIVRLNVSIRSLVEHAMAVGMVDKRPLPDFHDCLPAKIGKLIEAEQRKVDALTEAERTRL